MEYTRSQAVNQLFGEKLSEHEFFRLRLASLEDNQTLVIDRYEKQSGKDGRGKRVYQNEHLNRLYNVILISAFFPKLAIVKEIVTNEKHRKRHITDIQRLLGQREAVGQIRFKPDKLSSFFDFMLSTSNLDSEMAPNPFIELPQFRVKGKEPYISVYEAYKAIDIEKTDVERMLLAYFDRDIKKAYQIAQSLTDLDGYYSVMQEKVIRDYRDSARFDQILDDFL